MRPIALLLAAAVTFALACGARPEGASSPPSAGGASPTEAAPSEIARVHHAKCGACHLRVEPGERTRAEFEAALSRHHSRVHLTDAQWAAMIDYLAPR